MIGATVRAVVDRLATRTGRRHRAPTATAQDYALQQRAALAQRPRPLMGTVSGQLLGIGQEGLPRNVCWMMIAYQHLPLFPRQLATLEPNRTVGIHGASRTKAAKYVGASVRRIGQQLQHSLIHQAAPTNVACPYSAVGASWETASCERRHDRVSRSFRFEASKHVGDRRAHFFVRIDHQVALVVIDVANRQRKPELASLCRGEFGTLQAARE